MLCEENIRRGGPWGSSSSVLAQRLQDPDLLLEAHHTLWTTLLVWRRVGRPPGLHLEQGMKLYDPQRHRTHAALYSGHDPGVCCRMQAAHSFWLFGYPDQALASIQASLALAQQLAHPLSLTMALRWAAVAYSLPRLGEIVARRLLPQSDQAADCYRHATALADGTCMHSLTRPHCHLGLRYAVCEDWPTRVARAELCAAIELYRNLHMTFGLPQSRRPWRSHRVR